MTISLNATDFGTLDQTVAASQLVKQNIANLSSETSTGYISTDYAGLGAQASTALDLSAQIAHLNGLQTNASSAATTQQVAQTALGQIESIASNFAAQATTLVTTPSNAPAVAASAQGALLQVAQLLDTKVGDVYVFAGQDSANPPIPNPSALTQSAFYTAIQTAVAALPANGSTATAAATLAIAAPGGTSPFSATLEANGVQRQADLGDGARAALAPLANTNSAGPSTGAGSTSTGSYTRDLLRGLATLGSLASVPASDPNFVPLLQNTVASLQNVVSSANTDIGALGVSQQQVSNAQSDWGDVTTALLTQLGNVQDADLTTIATQLSSAQTQLQASYQIIASLGQLTLSKYI